MASLCQSVSVPLISLAQCPSWTATSVLPPIHSLSQSYCPAILHCDMSYAPPSAAIFCFHGWCRSVIIIVATSALCRLAPACLGALPLPRKAAILRPTPTNSATDPPWRRGQINILISTTLTFPPIQISPTFLEPLQTMSSLQRGSSTASRINLLPLRPALPTGWLRTVPSRCLPGSP